MKLSEKGLELIKSFEGCVLTAYKPVAAEQYYTIGYGHYGPDVTKGMTITQEQAEKYLLEDIVSFENAVTSTCSYLAPLTQNEFDALVSFTYNCGSGNLLKLTGNKTRTRAEIAEHITAYNKGADGKVLAGLTRRRTAEKKLFLDQEGANDEKFDYLGIRRFHNAGYKGQGISFASRESLTTHGKNVYEVMQLVAPKATLSFKRDYLKDAEGIDVYTTSMFSVSDKYEKNKKAAQELYNNDVFLCCAVGNYSDEKITELAKDPWWCSVGACTLLNGKPSRVYYSSVGEELDFMSFTNLTLSSGMFTGSSCAAPVFAGMVALVQSFFKAKARRKLTNKEMYKFILDNCVDLGDAGFDTKTGFGIFVLPDPDTIDIYKYIEEEEEMVRYQKIEEVPVWGKATIEKLIKYGFLKGDENGNLNLSEDMLRMLVILDRANVFNVDPEPVWEPEEERPGSNEWDKDFNM